MNFLFRVIHMQGVTAMATCQAMVGVLRLKSSSKVQMKLIRNTLRLNRQNPKNPVVRDTNSLQLFLFMIQLFIYNKRYKLTKC